jgi:hypothetical protein
LLTTDEELLSSLHYASLAEELALESGYREGYALACLSKGDYYVDAGNYPAIPEKYDIP